MNTDRDAVEGRNGVTVVSERKEGVIEERACLIR